MSSDPIIIHVSLTLFVLRYAPHYEPGWTLGVYNTEAQALKAWDEWVAEKYPQYPEEERWRVDIEREIVPCVLGAKAAV